MDKRQAKVEFSEYDFLALLLATKKANNDPVLINLSKIQRDLFPYFKNPEYRSLFIDVVARERIDDQYVDLSASINRAVFANMIELTPDGSNEVKAINYVLDDEAEMLINEAGERATKMDKIVKEIKPLSDTKKPYTMHPIKHNEENNK